MGRSISVLGDSVSTFWGWQPQGYAVYYDQDRACTAGLMSVEDTWWMRAARALDAEPLANASYSGSMVAGDGFPAGRSPERSRALLGPSGERPTDVVVFMGINDYGWGSPRAQAAARSAAMPACVDLEMVPPAVASAASPADVEEFEWAYGAMLGNVRSACGSSNIWCVGLLPGRVAGSKGPTFTWNLRGVPLDDYNDAINRAARAHGAVYLDVASYGLDYEAVDGTHPTARGMAQIAGLVAASMGEGGDPRSLEAFSTPEGSDGFSWDSARYCPGCSCLECPDAMDTGNTWRCVCTRGLCRPGPI